MSVTAVGSYEEEDFLTRSLAGPPLLPLSPSLPSFSSIGKASPALEAPRVERPALAAPNHYMLDLLDCYKTTENLIQKSTQNFKAEVSQTTADNERLEAEIAKAIEQEAEAIKSRSTWSILSNVSHYAMGIGTILLSSTCVGIPGTLLFASGVLAIANPLMHQTGFLEGAVRWLTHSEELQQKYTQTIETCLFSLQMGLGLAGGVWGWKTGAFTAAEGVRGFIQKASSVTSTASGVVSTSSQLGMKFYEKKMIELRADMKKMGAHVTIGGQTIGDSTREIGSIIKDGQTEADVLKRLIETSQVSSD